MTRIFLQCDSSLAKKGELLSVLPLLCLKFWHMHPQQQQWCNLVTRLWHLYSQPKPRVIPSINSIVFSVGVVLVFLVIAKGTKGEGWELCSPAPESKGDFSLFPALEANLSVTGYFESPQTKIAVLQRAASSTIKNINKKLAKPR